MRLSGLAAACLLVGCASAGVSGPPARPGEEVTTWVRMEQGFPGQTIYFWNNTDAPVVVETVELYDCVNVGRSACQYFRPELVLPPRAVSEFITLLPADPDRGHRFAYRYNFRALEEGAGP